MALTFKLTDSPPQPSISVEQLNTKLVKMRKIIKTSKLFTYRDLVKYIKKLRQKISKTGSNIKLQRKLDHRSEELQLLRNLSVVRLCKLLLANEFTKADLSKNGHKFSAQDRMIARLASKKHVATFVNDFRKEHPDWRSLVHYLLYKNVSGKFKSREQKRRNRKVHGDLPLPPSPSDQLISTDRIPDESWTIKNVRVSHAFEGEKSKADEKVSPPLDLDLDMDSDAASDIAEQVVNRAINRYPALRTQSSDQPELVTETTDEKTKSQMPGVYRMPGHTDHDFKFAHRRKSQRTENKEPILETVSPSMDPTLSDSDNPLGSDDVEVRKKVKSKRLSKTMNASRLDKPSVKRPNHAGRRAEKREMDSPGLHPSWQAKRELKMKMRRVSIVPSSISKHIVFAD